jgi:hypothetical protein
VLAALRPFVAGPLMGNSAAGCEGSGAGRYARTAPELASGPVGLPSPGADLWGMPMTRFRTGKGREKRRPERP